MAALEKVQALIDRYALAAHPEGGYFREVYRSQRKVTRKEKSYSALTDIYFLLPHGSLSVFHRITAEEVWHFYEGAPLRLIQSDPGLSTLTETLLGDGEYKHCIPAGYWQAAESTGDYSLVGCTVAPGFEFEDLEIMRAVTESGRHIARQYPTLSRFVAE